jgi:hypothetical protein
VPPPAAAAAEAAKCAQQATAFLGHFPVSLSFSQTNGSIFLVASTQGRLPPPRPATARLHPHRRSFASTPTCGRPPLHPPPLPPEVVRRRLRSYPRAPTSASAPPHTHTTSGSPLPPPPPSSPAVARFLLLQVGTTSVRRAATPVVMDP